MIKASRTPVEVAEDGQVITTAEEVELTDPAEVLVTDEGVTVKEVDTEAEVTEEVTEVDSEVEVTEEVTEVDSEAEATEEVAEEEIMTIILVVVIGVQEVGVIPLHGVQEVEPTLTLEEVGELQPLLMILIPAAEAGVQEVLQLQLIPAAEAGAEVLQLLLQLIPAAEAGAEVLQLQQKLNLLILQQLLLAAEAGAEVLQLLQLQVTKLRYQLVGEIDTNCLSIKFK